MKSVFFSLVLFIVFCSCRKIDRTTDDFVRGADMSFLPELKALGFVLKNSEGLAEDPLLTLRKAGVNTIRIRVWNNPEHPVSSPAVVRQLAAECRRHGFKVLLSLHYSDTWADPGHQQKPLAWQNLGLSTLRDSLYNFTFRIAKSVQPDYIQIGNEINGGILWPEGSSTNPAGFSLLLEAGIRAARTAHPSTKVVLHYAGIQGVVSFFESLKNMDYHVAAISYYPFWHGTNTDALQKTLTQLKTQSGREVMITETAYPFTLQWNDNTHNVIGRQDQLMPGNPATLQGQRDFVCMIRRITENAGAIGFCYWGAEWVSYKGITSTQGSSWENQALWDFQAKAVPAMECFASSK